MEKTGPKTGYMKKRVGKVDPRNTFIVYDWTFPGGYLKCDIHKEKDCHDCQEHNLKLEKEKIKGQDRTYHWIHYKGVEDPVWIKHRQELMDENGYGWWWYAGVSFKFLPEEEQARRASSGKYHWLKY